MSSRTTDNQQTARRFYSRLVKKLNAWQQNQLSVTMVDKRPLVVLVLLYITARITGGSFFHLLFRITVFLLLLCYFWTRGMKNNLQCIYEASAREVTRGEEVVLTLRFDNEGFLPISKLSAASNIPGEVEQQSWNVATTVPSLQSRLVQQTITLNLHGYYRLGPVTITLEDPMGWFQSRFNIYGERHLTVYPRLLHVRGKSLPLRRPFGSLRTRVRAFTDPSNLKDIHPMQPGDNPRHIHWPTTARMGEPYVREFELTASGEVHLVIDLSLGSEENQTKSTVARLQHTGTFANIQARETAFDLTAGLARTCLHNDLSVGLITPGANTGYSRKAWRGPKRMQQIINTLSRAQVNSPIPPDAMLQQVGHQVGSGSTILFITGELTPAVHSRLVSLVRVGLGVGIFVVKENQTTRFEHQAGQQPGVTATTTPFSLWTVTPNSTVVELDDNQDAGSQHTRRALHNHSLNNSSRGGSHE